MPETQSGLPDYLGKITGFVAAFEKHPKAARFALLAVVQNLLSEERVRVCCRVVVPQRTDVEIWHNERTNNARYAGLMKCGLSWICPICNIRIAEQRREILDAAFKNAFKTYKPFMVTYTTSHNKRMRLRETLDAMHKAYREIRQSRQWRVTKEEWSFIGEIRATEITYSFESGFHPHYHVLVIVPKDAVESEEDFITSLENQMFTYWSEFLERNGLHCDRQHGVKVVGANFANHYVAKMADWSISKELTRVASKTAHRSDSVTMFDLLLLYYAGDPMAGHLFKEYHAATKGRSSLQWSPKLKALLGVDKLSDDPTLEQEPDIQERLLMRLTLDDWRAILNAEAEGHVLDLAAEGDYEKVARFLLSLAPKQV